MEFFSVNIHWTKPDGSEGNIRFVCQKAQVVTQIDAALNNEVGPVFKDNCNITVTSIGAVRGPTT